MAARQPWNASSGGGLEDFLSTLAGASEVPTLHLQPRAPSVDVFPFLQVMPGLWQSIASFGAAFIAMHAYGPGRPVLDPWQPNQVRSFRRDLYKDII